MNPETSKKMENLARSYFNRGKSLQKKASKHKETSINKSKTLEKLNEELPNLKAAQPGLNQAAKEAVKDTGKDVLKLFYEKGNALINLNTLRTAYSIGTQWYNNSKSQ
jgi:type VI protein secretion system component VasK